jgi:hypothetical protein
VYTTAPDRIMQDSTCGRMCFSYNVILYSQFVLNCHKNRFSKSMHECHSHQSYCQIAFFTVHCIFFRDEKGFTLNFSSCTGTAILLIINIHQGMVAPSHCTNRSVSRVASSMRWRICVAVSSGVFQTSADSASTPADI